MQRTMTKKASLAAFIASVALLLAFCMPSAAFADDQGVYRESYNLCSADYAAWSTTWEAFAYTPALQPGTYTVSVQQSALIPTLKGYFIVDGKLSYFGPSTNGSLTFTVTDKYPHLEIFFDGAPSAWPSGAQLMLNEGSEVLPYEEYGKKYFNTGILTKPFQQLGAWCIANAAKVIPFACIVMGIAIVVLVIVRRYKKMVK